MLFFVNMLLRQGLNGILLLAVPRFQTVARLDHIHLHNTCYTSGIRTGLMAIILRLRSGLITFAGSRRVINYEVFS
jgi:hypothetical protein